MRLFRPIIEVVFAVFDVPIAFVIFNRPAITKVSFQRIQTLRPNRLFIISDGPRAERLDEIRLVEQSRQIAEQVDWPCDVQKIYASENMGCGRRISSGISKVFETVDRAIILEDDCIAESSFFSYCQTLLDYYQDDQRVMAISGNNFQLSQSRTKASYYFSKYPHCWGWATWRRAWKQFDLGVRDWPGFRDSGHLSTICSSQREMDYWTQIFNKSYAGEGSSWAYPWTCCCWMNHGLTVLPDVNLVSNHGFGADATHTQQRSGVAGLPTRSLEKLIHPGVVHRHFLADQFTDEWVFSGARYLNRPFRRFRHAIKAKFRAA